MDGTLITHKRTGAAGAIAAEVLAKKNISSVAIIGAGMQARTQLEGLLTLYKNLDQVKIFDTSKININKFIKNINIFSSKITKINNVKTIEQAVRGSDIIVTATPSRKPLVKDSWVSSGVHINCIGADAPGKQEVELKLIKRAKIVIDDLEQALHSGEINVPISQGSFSKKNIYAEIGDILVGSKAGRTNENEITLFSSTGLAIQDSVTAKLVYDKAINQGIGKWIELFNTSNNVLLN
jgi:alanine dehydrogenase